MHRTLAALSLLVLAACGVEPEAVGEADLDALLLEANVSLKDLLKLERCWDGIDNDGDGKIDQQDPDCPEGGTFGGGGFLGGAQEGTGISDPWDNGGGGVELFGDKAEWSYVPGDEKNDSVLTIIQYAEKEDLVTEIHLKDEVIDSFQGVSDRRFGDCLIVTTRQGSAWLAAGPLGNTTFVEPAAGERR